MIGLVADQGSLKLTLLLDRKSKCCKVLPATRSRNKAAVKSTEQTTVFFGGGWRSNTFLHYTSEWIPSLLLSCFILFEKNVINFHLHNIYSRERASYLGWGHSGSTHSYNAERRFFDLRQKDYSSFRDSWDCCFRVLDCFLRCQNQESKITTSFHWQTITIVVDALVGPIAVSHDIIYRNASQESTTGFRARARRRPLYIVVGRSDMIEFMWLEIRCA
jgi:hypothetical protein